MYIRLVLRKAELEQRPKTKNPFKMFANYRAARLFLVASKSLYKATKVTIHSKQIPLVFRVFRSPPEQNRGDDENDRERSVITSRRRCPTSGQYVSVVLCLRSIRYLLSDDVPPDASISGIAVRLDRPLDDTMRQQILDAANTIASFSGPFGGDGEASGEGVENLTTIPYSVYLPDTSTFLTDDYILASESLASLVSSNAEEATDDTISPLPPSSPVIIQNHYSFYGSIYSPNSHVYGATVHTGGENNSGC